MTTRLPDLAPDEWRVTRPRVIQVDELGVCDLDDCEATARVCVTWTPGTEFGSRLRCLGDAEAALELALVDSPADTQIIVEYLVLRAPVSNAA